MPPLCKFRRPALTLFLLTVFSGTACAEESASGTYLMDVAFTLTAVTDYRYRGLSLSNKKPALQAELSVGHHSGLYTRLWGSSIADNGGADIETQATLGYNVEFGAFSADVQGAYYFYPGAAADNYGEVAMRLGRSFGPSELGATVSYAPAQRNIGNVDNLYAGLDGSAPLLGGPVTISASFGVEDGAFGDRKLDWSLGVSGEAAGLSVGLAYVDASRTSGDRLGKPTLVASVSGNF